MFSQPRSAPPELTEEGSQGDDTKVIRVGRSRDLLAHINSALKFFSDFALKNFAWSFARLYLPAWELPHVGQAAIWTPLSAQYLAVIDDDGAYNADFLFHTTPLSTIQDFLIILLNFFVHPPKC